MQYLSNNYNFTLKIAVFDESFNKSVQRKFCAYAYSSINIPLLILCEITKFFHINTEIVQPKNGSYGVCNSLECDGVMELLRTNQAHVAGSSLTLTVTRFPHFTNVYADFEWKPVFVYANKLSESIQFEGNFKQPFDPITFIVLFWTFSMFWLRKCLSMKSKKQFYGKIANIHCDVVSGDICEAFWCSLQEFIGQTETKSLMILLCFTQMTIWYYAGCRGQVLKSIEPQKAFSNMQELSSLIQSKTIKLITISESQITQFNGSNPEFVNLLEKKEFHPIKGPLTETGGQIVCEKGNITAIMYTNVKKYPTCDITLDTTLFRQISTPKDVFAFAKGDFPMKKQLMDIMGHWNEMMLINKAIVPKMFKNLETLGKMKGNSISNSVKLTSLKWAFGLIGLLYALALCVLFLEIYNPLLT